jgi:hypothetical protein
MREQVVKGTRVAAAVAGAVVLAMAPLWAQSGSGGATAGQPPKEAPAAKSGKVSRLADGRPDLQGLWSYASALPLERPDPSAPNLSGNPDEAQFDEVVGNYGQVWYEPGSRTDGRKWLLVDPPDGRIPPLTPEAGRRLRAMQEARRGLAREDPTPGGWIEDTGPTHLKLRCLIGFNSGPPMTSAGYNQHVQIFQVPGYVGLFTEMIHNARIVPMDGRPHGTLRQWSGDPRGHWEGDTLVVDSVNFRAGPPNFPLASANMHLIERFTPVAPDTVLYEFTMDDPATWVRPWTVRIPLTRTDERMYEYACHEGNYGLYNILAGARAKERAQEAAAKK